MKITPLARCLLCILFTLSLLLGGRGAAPALAQPALSAGSGGITHLTGPAGSGEFGKHVTLLPNGNLVVTDPAYSTGSASGVGAVYLYHGQTLEQISVITGSQAGDQVGASGVVVLADGSFVILSPYWKNGAAEEAGAVTHCLADVGCQGQVSPANSLVGSSAKDRIGTYGTVYPLGEDRYVVRSVYWDNAGLADAGSLTICRVAQPCTGAISSANSMVGTHALDRAGERGPLVLKNGSLLMSFPRWNGEIGAVTLCGPNGCTGEITAANSLVGSTAGDRLGSYVKELTNDSYVVSVPQYDRAGVKDAGVVIYCPTGGCTGAVSVNRAIYGTTAGDMVGYYMEVFKDGYVIRSPDWSKGGVAKAGAVTWCDNAPGCAGEVNAANSLTGSTANDRVGSTVRVLQHVENTYLVLSHSWDFVTTVDVGAVTWCQANSCAGEPVSGYNSLIGQSAGDGPGGGPYGLYLYVEAAYSGTSTYMIAFPSWDKGALKDVGLVTWCDVTTGCTGMVDPSQSLVGEKENDNVGMNAHALHTGHYILRSYNWNDQTGAVTVCHESGCEGQVVSAANSLVGSQPGDQVGYGNYTVNVVEDQVSLVVSSFMWNNQAGAVTYCASAAACRGEVSPANSLVGSTPGDQLGYGIELLESGGYILSSPDWDNGSIVDAGAVTWCGKAGCQGSMAEQKNLVGASEGDRVGSGGVSLLYTGEWELTGSYVVASPEWDNAAVADAGAAGTIMDAGAVTFCSAGGCQGQISAANSLVGLAENDRLGEDDLSTFNNGSYLVGSFSWDNGAEADAGAYTWCSSSGCRGAVSANRSALNEAASSGTSLFYVYDEANQRLVISRWPENKVTLLSMNFCTLLPAVVR